MRDHELCMDFLFEQLGAIDESHLLRILKEDDSKNKSTYIFVCIEMKDFVIIHIEVSCRCLGTSFRNKTEMEQICLTHQQIMDIDIFLQGIYRE